jgi:cytochrome c
MKKILLLICLSFFILGLSAQEQKMKDLKAFVDKAGAYLAKNADNEEKVLKEFSDTKGDWVKGEFYLYVYDFKGVCIAHGAKNDMIGQNLIALKDSDGVEMIKQFTTELKNKDSYYSKFKFANPLHGGKIEPKQSYNIKVKTKNHPEGIIIGSGYYY